jgi:hypothetical protein
MVLVRHGGSRARESALMVALDYGSVFVFVSERIVTD